MIKETIRQYSVATTVAAAVFASSWLYNGGGLKISSPVNRGLADTSMFLLGTALVLGVLSRLYSVFDKFLTYRKELGIVAFFTGAVHVYLAMFPLARRGPWGFYESRPWSAIPGLLGLILMFLLFVISFKAIEEKLGTARWWKMQYWGARIAGLGVLTHIAVFRGPEWWGLIKSGRGEVPSSLMAASFGLFVLLSRLVELAGQKFAKAAIPILGLTIFGFNAWLMLR